jgi:lipid-A-disaccharide synthase
LISSAPTVEQSRIRKIMEDVLRGDSKEKLFRILKRNSKDILANADFALVKSGTSSLEAALVGTPFLITYRISSISWLIGSALIRSPMKGLVNLIAREKIVPELFQGEAKPQELARVALQYLESPEESAAMRVRLSKIREKLSMRCASETAAATVSSYL